MQVIHESFLKRTVPRDFNFQFFHGYPIRAISIFWKIRGDIPSSKCTTVSTKPVANGKKLKNYLVWTPLCNRLYLKIHFSFQFSRAVDIGDNLPQCCWHRRQVCRLQRWHQQQICHHCCWYWWCTLICEYLREFSNKFEMPILLFSAAWGKMIHEKNLEQKILWHFLLNVPVGTRHIHLHDVKGREKKHVGVATLSIWTGTN